MGERAADGMSASAVLGAAFARGCAPEGAIPIELDGGGVSRTPPGQGAHVEAGLKAIARHFSRAFGKKQRTEEMP